MDIESNFFGLLRTLVRHEVAFMIVGGVAAVLHGAPIMTADLDVLVDPEPPNLDHLLAALTEVEAHYLDPAGRVIAPDASKLATFRLNLFETKLGRLDVLRKIGAGKTFKDFLDRTITYQVEDLRLQVLDLPAIIETKEFAGRPKDLQSLPFLRELLDLTQNELSP